MPKTPLNAPRGDLEYKKFCKVTDDEIAVRTCAEINGGNITINSPVSRRITTMLVGDTATKIPASPLSGRIALSVQNLTETDILFLGNSDVESGRTVGGKGGWEVGAGESYNENIDDQHDFYGIAASGKSILIKVQEWSKT